MMNRESTLVRDALLTYVQNKIPSFLERARIDWGLTSHTLPDVAIFSRIEIPELANYPAIVVNIISTDNYSVRDINDRAEELYLVEYKVSLMTFVKTPVDVDGMAIFSKLDTTENEDTSLNETIRLRDDYSAIMTNLLLDSRTLGNAGIYWEPNSLEVEYSDYTKVKGNRYVAGVKHNFDLKFDEQLYREIIGTAGTLLINPIVLLPYPKD